MYPNSSQFVAQTYIVATATQGRSVRCRASNPAGVSLPYPRQLVALPTSCGLIRNSSPADVPVTLSQKAIPCHYPGSLRAVTDPAGRHMGPTRGRADFFSPIPPLSAPPPAVGETQNPRETGRRERNGRDVEPARMGREIATPLPPPPPLPRTVPRETTAKRARARTPCPPRAPCRGDGWSLAPAYPRRLSRKRASPPSCGPPRPRGGPREGPRLAACPGRSPAGKLEAAMPAAAQPGSVTYDLW